MAQKVNKYFGNFCEGMRLQNLSKIAQSGHTGQQQQRRRLHRVQGRRRSFQNLFSNVKRQVSLSLFPFSYSRLRRKWSNKANAQTVAD